MTSQAHARASQPPAGLARLCGLAIGCALLTGSPAMALDLEDVAREGELRFLASRPDPHAYWYASRVDIDADNLDTGVVRLTTCHHQLDPNWKTVIAFNPDRVRALQVASSRGIGQSEVKGHLIELADVKRGAQICINLTSQALDRVNATTWRLHAGPLMRQYLDGYLPMRAELSFRWPEGLLQVGEVVPGEQPGVQLKASASGADLNLVFAGRMRATIALIRATP